VTPQSKPISVIDDDRGRSGLYRSVDVDGNEGYRDAIFFDVDGHRVVAAWMGVRKYCYKANASGSDQHRRRVAAIGEHRS